MVQMEYANELSHETAHQMLSENELKPWLREQWCIPPKADAGFVCNMEDVLEVYKRPYDPKRPLICMDEMLKQLLMDVQEPLPMLPDQPERSDYVYKQGGVVDLFMLFEPLTGKRHIETWDQRRRIE
jgi:hypothetical protein